MRLRMKKIRKSEDLEDWQITGELGYIKDGVINSIDNWSLKLNNLISKTRSLKKSQTTATNLKQVWVMK